MLTIFNLYFPPLVPSFLLFFMYSSTETKRLDGYKWHFQGFKSQSWLFFIIIIITLQHKNSFHFYV